MDYIKREINRLKSELDSLLDYIETKQKMDTENEDRFDVKVNQFGRLTHVRKIDKELKSKE